MKKYLIAIFLCSYNMLFGQITDLPNDSLSGLNKFLVEHNALFETEYPYLQIYSVEEGIENPQVVWSLLLTSILDSGEGPYSIPKAIGHLTSLKEISIECETRVIIPSEISFLDSLRVLWTITSPMKDGDIPLEIKDCKRLAFLGLIGDNSFSKIPEGILLSRSLCFLDIDIGSNCSRKMFNSIMKLAESRNLEEIYIRGACLNTRQKNRLISKFRQKNKIIKFR